MMLPMLTVAQNVHHQANEKKYRPNSEIALNQFNSIGNCIIFPKNAAKDQNYN